MGQGSSCPCCNSDSNVHFPDEPEKPYPRNDTIVPSSRLPEEDVLKPILDDTSRPPARRKAPVREWDPFKNQPDTSFGSSQCAGEDPVVGGGGSEMHTSPDDMADHLRNVKGSLTFRKSGDSSGRETRPVTPQPPVETPAQKVARERREAHNDRIVATFNSVMLADGLKVLKHHRRSSKKAASRVIRFVPEYGGALVWDKPLRQPGAKPSRVPLDAISRVELEQRIVWISAGEERVGFETSKAEDADLMYQAICILVDRCHAAQR